MDKKKRNRIVGFGFFSELCVCVLLSAGKMFLLENNTIDIGEVDVGRRAIQDVPPGSFYIYCYKYNLILAYHKNCAL